MATPERVEIEVGGKLYNISTIKIPYFASHLDFQCHSGQTSKKHDDIPFFEAAYQGAERGLRHCFRNLDPDITAYHTLCDTLDFLCIDTLGGRSVDVVIEDLKSGKGHYEVDYKRPFFVKGNKAIARDSCFRLLYLISRAEFEDDTKASQQIYQATANHWNALILLDEADVYLEQRSSKDVGRNKLVSVFLRKLEYCDGIMFLTTNRVPDFDEAILSKIHLMLKYDGLDFDVRSQIWKHMLRRAHTSQGGPVMAREEMKRLAGTKFNGRQIKNVVTIAHALATKNKTQVAYSHILQAVKASENFFHEFNGTSVIESLYR